MLIIPASAMSWLEVDSASHFPIQNLPFGVLKIGNERSSVVTALGDYAINLTLLRDAGYLSKEKYPNLENLEFARISGLSELRSEIYEFLRADSDSRLRNDRQLLTQALVPLEGAELLLPLSPRAFVDFYSGIHHASNVGKMFRPDQPPLLPNYLHIPIGYNGRASSVVVSGTPIRRPNGQRKLIDEPSPIFGPTLELDFELEMGFFTSSTTQLGETIPIDEASDHFLGFVLVNDWSARDLQRWEYQPLGPFLAKSFATSISPWIVLPDALEPFRISDLHQDPAPLPYLQPTKPYRYDIKLQVQLQTSKMIAPEVISHSNAKYLYWSFDQQLAHQASNGTPLSFGDLYASGTISGPVEDSYGSLLEITWRGSKPLQLGKTGETRTFLEDGDSLELSGYCQGDGFRVGFGTVRGTILAN